MLYFHDFQEDAYCPVCGWEHETAKRETATPVSRRERRRRRSLFPIDLSGESFFLDGAEFEYRSVREIVFWFTARSAPWALTAPPFHQMSHEYKLSFRAGDTPISISRKVPAGGSAAALSTGENYLIQVYRALRTKSFHERVAARKREFIENDRAVFGRLVITRDGSFTLRRRRGALADYTLDLHGSHLCATRRGARRPRVCVPSRDIPDMDVALALIRALRNETPDI